MRILLGMRNETYQRALADLQAKLARSVAKRDAANAEIAQLQADIRAISNLLGQYVEAEAGWTDLIRTVVYNAQGKVTAAQVRDTLQAWGYDLSGFKNPLGFIHTTLQRLSERGELERSVTRRPFMFGRKG
jgi:hypothetical protein